MATRFPFWAALAVLTADLAFTENLGLLTRPLNVAVGLGALAGLAAMVPGWARRRAALAIGIAVQLVAAALLVRSPAPIAPALVTVFLAGVWLRAEPQAADARSALGRLAAANVAFGLLFLLAATSPTAWSWSQRASLATTGALARVTGMGVPLANSFSGLAAVGFVVCLVGVRRFGSGPHRAVATATLRGIAGVGLSWIAFLALAVHVPALLRALLPHARPALGEVAAAPDLPLRLTLGLPLLVVVAMLPHLRAPREPHAVAPSATRAPASPSRAFRRRAFACAVAAVLLVAGVLLADVQRLRQPAGGPAARPLVLLYERGYLNWIRPTMDNFGRYSGGMFGTLPDHLQSIGIDSRRTAEFDETELAGAAAVVVINTDHSIPESGRAALWRFVERGGALLVLGDHTFERDGKAWLNELLAPIHIRFQFDSAAYFVGGWLHSYAFARHPIGRDVGEAHNDPGIVIGASLALASPAAPLVVGRYGFSDHGDAARAEEGALGNMQLDAGEQIGDLVLAAVEPYGRGKVLVFGDTSGFTNQIAAVTHPFVLRVFRWLVSPSQDGAAPAREIGAAMLVGLGLVLLAWARPSTVVAALVPVPALVASVAAAAPDPLRAVPTGRIAYVDVTHFPQTPLDFGRDNGLGGVMLNLCRRGYHGLWLQEWSAERLAQARLLVLVAPSRPFSAPELASLRAWIERGGILLLGVGYEESGPCRNVLAAVGFEIDPIPLGRDSVLVEGGGKAIFVEAWPVRSAATGVTPVAHLAGEPVIVLRRIGRGVAVCIGDSKFLANHNLEHEDHPHMESIQFFHWLVEQAERAVEAGPS